MKLMQNHFILYFFNLQTLIQIATEAFVKELGLEDGQLLKGAVQVRDLSAGTYIMKEESHKVS